MLYEISWQNRHLQSPVYCDSVEYIICHISFQYKSSRLQERIISFVHQLESVYSMVSAVSAFVNVFVNKLLR